MDDHPSGFRSEAEQFDKELFQGTDDPQKPYPRLSSQDQSFLEDLIQLPPLGSLSLAEERIRMREGQVTHTEDYPVVIEPYQTTACLVHLVRPLDLSTPAPVLFYLHGGGWVLGDIGTHLKLVCELAVGGRCVVAFIDYPRAPEHVFPVPLQASVAAMQEILHSSEALGLDKNRFAIGGDSAGGNLTSALILQAIEHKLPLPVQQILLYPATDHNFTTASYEQFADNPNLSRPAMEWFWNSYLPDKSLHKDARISPLQADDAILAQFPPTLLIACEYDVLRDEGESFAARLVQAGVDVTAVRWLGSLHGFLVNESLSGSTSARTCIDMVAQYIRRGFETD